MKLVSLHAFLLKTRHLRKSRNGRPAHRCSQYAPDGLYPHLELQTYCECLNTFKAGSLIGKQKLGSSGYLYTGRITILRLWKKIRLYRKSVKPGSGCPPGLSTIWIKWLLFFRKSKRKTKPDFEIFSANLKKKLLCNFSMITLKGYRMPTK